MNEIKKATLGKFGEEGLTLSCILLQKWGRCTASFAVVNALLYSFLFGCNKTMKELIIIHFLQFSSLFVKQCKTFPDCRKDIDYKLSQMIQQRQFLLLHAEFYMNRGRTRN